MKQINLQENLRKKFMKKRVKMIAPDTVFFSKDTIIGKNVSIEPYVVFGKKVKIHNNVTIHSFSHLENTKIENNVTVGPYARLRPGTILKSGSRVGNFVEVKKSIIGKKSKVQIEFVSVNPTGPIHIGHARGAVFGSVLANILKVSGYNVFKEYYINDAGKQIDILTISVLRRYHELIDSNKVFSYENIFYIHYYTKTDFENYKRWNIK